MKFLKTIIFLFISNTAFSQLSIDSGGDSIVLCQEPVFIPLTLGGNPTVINGVGPFIYTWSIDEPFIIPGSAITLHASDFLNDTTTSNPIVIDGFGLIDSLKFHLSVIDSNGEIATDSSMVYFSIYSIAISSVTFNILEGDSVFCDYDSYLNSPFNPSTYLWRPNHGLTDSTSLTFVTKPTSSIAYYLTITNSLGCTFEGPPFYYIFVHYLDINNLLAAANETTLYPNPSNGELIILNEQKNIKSIAFYNTQGQLIAHLEPTQSIFDLSHYSKGTYIVKISFEQQTISRKLVLK